MASQCVVITLILVIIILCFYKTKQKDWALAAVPLLVLPLIHSLSVYVYRYFLKSDMETLMTVSVITVSAIVSCVWVGINAEKFLSRKKERYLYLGISVAFVILLALILLNYAL